MPSNAMVFSKRVDATISTQTPFQDYQPERTVHELFDSLAGYNYQIHLEIALQNPAVTNWHERINGQYEPFAIPFVLHVPTKGRFRTATEQKIFHRALQRSVKFVAETQLRSE